MEKFQLDTRLENNAVVIGKMFCSKVLLMTNKEVPWFILVPEVANISELYELDERTQALLLREINLLSLFVKKHFQVDKLNVAAIGNIVNQFHVHVVGRSKTDCAWPGVVWGMQQHTAYTQAEIDEVTRLFDLYQQENR